MRLRYAALSDVGRVRRDNQDSGYAGPHLLVVADGVGGSARGDIASAATVEELRRLDAPPGNDMLSALAGSIHRSHDRIARLVQENPEIEGTSSTVTAAIFDGTHVGLGHVGDSRGYLLRDGTLSQLTTDHTFVQSLIDEGRITEEEARVHPHRNLILRAVDGVHEPEPDVFTIEAAPGDRLLLCSDGCCGSLDDAALAGLLGEGTPDQAAVSLVQAALEAGSTDNVTVVVADLVDEADPVDDQDAGAAGPLLVGAAAEAPRRRPLAGRATGTADTGELDPVPSGPRDVDPEEARYAPLEPRRHPVVRRLAILVLVLVLLALVLIGGYKWTQTQYYVASSGEKVVIYQGIEADLPGVRLHHVEETSPMVLADLPSYRAKQVTDGISANSLAQARATLANLRRDVPCPEPTPSPSPTASASKKATASPTGSASSQAGTRRTTKASPTPSPSPSPSTPTRTPAVCQTS